MIRLLTGDHGSGKTSALADAIAARVAAGERAYLLVPEQQTVLSEREMADRLPAAATLTFEVTNFTRLANTVFRRVGGLSYHYADAGTRTLVMWRAMGELLPLLHDAGAGADLGYVRKMTAAMAELSALSLSPTALSEAAKKLPPDARLHDKLEDLSLLSTLYRAMLHEQYGDTAEDLSRLADLLDRADLLDGAPLYVDGFTSFTEQEYRVLRALSRHSDLTVTLTLPAGREDALPFAETRECARRLMRLAADNGIPFAREDLGDCRRAAAPLLRYVTAHLFAPAGPDGPAPENMPPSGRGVSPQATGGEGAENALSPHPCVAKNETDAAANAANATGAVARAASPATEAATAALCTPPLRVGVAPDPFAAAEYVAADIWRRVQEEGARFRDFAVVVRRAEDYAGVLDTAMARAGIPCFMARHTDITAYAAVKLIFSAYTAVCGGFRTGDVIAYLKCGMTGISPDDADVFELYVSRWKISGRRMTDDIPWNMNPDGYTDTLTPRGEAVLRTAQAVREAVCAQLLPLSQHTGPASVTEHARVLYEFLDARGVEDQLRARADAARAAGDTGEGGEFDRLFPVLLDALDRLVDTVGGVTVTAEVFADLLRLLLSEVELARIPTAFDEVTVGAADLLRIGDARHIYLVGVNEGEFPAPATEGGVFSEGDRAALSALGLPVVPDLSLRAARELFCFARAFASARESVTLLCAENSATGKPLRPSDALRELLSLAGVAPFRTADLPPLAFLYQCDAAADRQGLLHGTPEGAALDAALAMLERRPAAAAPHDPLFAERCRLSPAVAACLAPGGRLTLSQSRLEKYVGCPYAYFCEQVLYLQPDKPVTFDAANIGTLLHAVMERLFRETTDAGRSVGDLSRQDIAALVDKLADEYLCAVCRNEGQRTPRLLHLFARLRRLATLAAENLVAEMAQSEFRPLFLEMDFTEKAPDAPGMLPVVLPSGVRVSLVGRADRVDVFREGEKTYLRVIDYKSGGKKFDLAAVEEGLNTQMLMYLFSLWRSENPRFREKVAGAGELLPAGILYVGLMPDDKVYDSPAGAGDIREKAAASLSRSGYFLRDERVLRAMDRELSGRYIPIRMTKDGGFQKNSLPSLADLETLGAQVGKLQGVIARIAGEMTAGVADIRPRRARGGERSPCAFCEMRFACRRRTDRPGT